VSTTSAAGGDDTTDDDSDASLGLAPPPDLRAEWASVLPAAAALPNPRPATAPAAMARQHATPVAKPAWMDEGDAGASSAKAVTAKPKSASIWCDCRRCVAPPPGHAAEAVVPSWVGAHIRRNEDDLSDEDEPATADAQRPRVCEAAAESEPFFIRAAKPSEAVAGAKAATKPKATRIMIEEVAAETDAVQLERPPVAAAVPTAQTGAKAEPSELHRFVFRGCALPALRLQAHALATCACTHATVEDPSRLMLMPPQQAIGCACNSRRKPCSVQLAVRLGSDRWAVDAGEFVPMAKFGGARKGYVFKAGELGLGYYVDRAHVGDAERPTDEAKEVSVSTNEEEEEERRLLDESLGFGGAGQAGGLSDVCSLLDSAHTAALASAGSGGLLLDNMDELD
jgi:hypothetical protein